MLITLDARSRTLDVDDDEQAAPMPMAWMMPTHAENHAASNGMQQAWLVGEGRTLGRMGRAARAYGSPGQPPEIRHFTKRCRGREKGKEAAARHSPGESIVRGRARVVSEHVSERKITKSFVSRA